MGLTMRGRYLMREWWSDSDLFRRLTAEEREVLLGLWMLADDGGVIPRDVPAIAAAIYPYRDTGDREPFIRRAVDRLVTVGKLTKLGRCCLHAPSVEKYPRAGAKSYEHRDEHRKHVDASRRESTPVEGESTPSPDPTLPRPVPSPVPSRPPAGAREAEPRAPRTGMTTAAEAAGGFVATLAARRAG